MFASRAHDPADPPRLVFSLGLALSLLLHMGVGAWLLGSGVSLAGDRAGANAEMFEKPDRVTELGEPDSDATTITWIGYREYEEHLAMKSETEQALQTPDDAPSEEINTPALAPSAASVETAERTDPSEPTPPASPAPEPALASVPEEPAETSVSPTETPAPEPPASGETVITNATPDRDASEPVVVAPGEALVLAPIVGPAPIDSPDATARSSPDDAPTAEPESAEPTEQPAEATHVDALTPQPQQRPPAQPSPSRARPSAAPAPPAVPSDREAVATAIKAADRYKPGRPLASRGLRIQTVRPELSHYNSIFAQHRSVVARIFFARNGKPIDVVLLQSSLHNDVDRNTLDALFQWRAEGPQLEALPMVTPPGFRNHLIQGDSLTVGAFERFGQATIAVDIEILP